ncbi:Protein-L-isoaspartate(D-aspartate) O-methyltransferase [Chlorella vulgaris]
MRGQDALVDHLKRDGVVTKSEVEQVLRQCDRRHYVDAGMPAPYVYQASSWSSKVIGIEKHPELAEQSVKNVQADHPELLDSGVVELRAGNALGDVLEREEPFDAIHMALGGRMVIPVGAQWEYQVMQCIDKDAEGRIKKHDLMHVRYVPLTRPGETWDS